MAGFIAEIVNKATGELVGMGILVTSDRVLTCAHVVNQVLNRERLDDPIKPGKDELIALRFPFYEQDEKRGKVLHWHPTDDICVLSLTSPFGPELEPAWFVETTSGQEFQAPRSTGLESAPGWAPGVVGKPSINGLYEINNRPGAHEDDVIIAGCSGGPLIDEKTRHVLGMVVFANPVHKEAHCLSTQRIKHVYDRVKMAPAEPPPAVSPSPPPLPSTVPAVTPPARMTRRHWLLTGGSAVVAAGVAGGWWMMRKPTMRIGIKPFVGYAPLKVAAELGLCPKVNIEFVDVKSVPLMRDGVKSGRLHAGLWLTCTHGLFRSEHTPVQAKAVLKLDESKDGDAIVVWPGIENFKDLIGKKIALQKLDAGDFLVRSLCVKENVNFNDLTTTDLNPREAANQFIGKEFDAATTYEPYLTTIRDKTGVGPKWTAKDLERYGIVDILAVREDFLAEHEDAIKSLIEGWYKAVGYLRQSNKRAIEIAVSFLRDPDGADYTSENLKQDLRPDVIDLADKAANRKFFSIMGGESESWRHYQNGLKVFGRDIIKPFPFNEWEIPDKFHPS